MNEARHDHEHHDAHSHRPRWKRVHHSWIFWVAVFLMLVAMITYVMTGDLFWGLRGQSSPSNARIRTIRSPALVPYNLIANCDEFGQLPVTLPPAESQRLRAPLQSPLPFRFS